MLYDAMVAAMRSDDVDAYAALLADDFRYIRHKSGDWLSKDQMTDLLRKVWGGGNRTLEDIRLIYENDDILVIHMRLAFASGSREAALVAHLKENDLITRIESGVSEIGGA